MIEILDFAPYPERYARASELGPRLLKVKSDIGGPVLHLLQMRPFDEGGTELLWAAELSSSKGLVTLKGQTRDGACVFGNQFGAFYLYDPAQQQCRLLHDYQSKFGSVQGVVNSDGDALLVLLYEMDKDTDLTLQRLPLIPEVGAVSEISAQLYDEDCFGGGYDYLDEDGPYFCLNNTNLNQRLYAGPDNSLLMHVIDEDEELHYMVRIDIQGEGVKFKVFLLDDSVLEWDPEPGAIAVCPQRALAAIPVIRETDAGVVIGVEWLNLDNGERSEAGVVRLCEDEEDALFHLEQLDTSIWQADGLWLSWSDGLVVRLALDPQTPPLTLLAKGQLLHVGTELIFSDREELLRCPFPEPAQWQGSPIPLSLESCHWQHNWRLSEAQRQALQCFGHTLIKVADLESTEGQLDALRQLQSLTQDCSKLLHGKTLAFRFTDGKQQWDEARFFQRSACHAEALPLMAQILQQFCRSFDGSDQCDGANWGTPLASCALQLGLQDVQYLPLITEYGNALDVDHENFFGGEGDALYQLSLRHGDRPEWQAFLSLHSDTEEDEVWD